MLFANFVTKSSVDAELPEQQRTFWGVLYSVLGQTNAVIRACIAINKKNDDRRAILTNAK